MTLDPGGRVCLGAVARWRCPGPLWADYAKQAGWRKGSCGSFRVAILRSAAHAPRVAPDPRDFELRQRALEHIRVLWQRYNQIIPVDVLGRGFDTRRGRISYGSFYSGIYRPSQIDGPAALCLVTAPPNAGRDAPYEDEFDEASGTFTYHHRRPDQTAFARLSAAADNRARKEALRLGVPLHLLQRHCARAVHARGAGVSDARRPRTRGCLVPGRPARRRHDQRRGRLR